VTGCRLAIILSRVFDRADRTVVLGDGPPRDLTIVGGEKLMPRARCVVSREAIAAAFAKAREQADRPFVSPKQLGQIIGVSRKTVYAWIAKGRLDGSFRKRGKHLLIWRDKAIDLVLNGPEWSD
jgi:predicted DNA-binding transcriptional regulator AlpA